MNFNSNNSLVLVAGKLVHMNFEVKSVPTPSNEMKTIGFILFISL